MSHAVLVLSSDRYSHVWPGFFKAWTKYFPNCRYPVYLGSNSVSYSGVEAKTILSGDDPDWSTSLRRILKQIPEEWLFIVLEDLIPASPVDSAHMARAFDFLNKNNGKYMKYYLPPPPDRAVAGEPFGEYARFRPYRMSVVGFWNKNYLASLLIPGENPWNFEIMGSYRTSYDDGFFMTDLKICDFMNMIEKGQWYPKALKWANSEQLDVGASSRGTLSGFYLAKSKLQRAIYWGLQKMPWTWRLGIMNFLRRLFGSY